MKRRRYQPKPDDGLCGHPSGLRTPYEMEMIARTRMAAMENHPQLEWMRREDAEALIRPARKRGRFRG